MTHVIDGDTIEVTIDGTTSRVRYIGIDTPENGDTASLASSYYNRQLVEGKAVILVKDQSETDQYGRLLRYVIVGNTFVNYQLVIKGYADTSTFPPDVACVDTFIAAKQTAWKNRLGLWALEPTTPPLPAPVIPIPSSGGSSTGGQNRGNCDPNYPTVCIHPYPPDLDCGQIPYRNFSVPGADPHGFDGNDDGVGCET